jgi:diadenosine tetraphosphate (Ap4A) HIT family hydrolase
MSKVKILLVGSVGENFEVLSKKLESLNSSKAGPFDVCFCVGPIDVPSDLATSLPLPVYMQGHSPSDSTEQTPSSSQSIISLGNNMFNLQASDDSKSVSVFEIKLSNHPDPMIVASCSRHIRADSESQEIQQCDVLLSSDWPQGMEDVLNVETEPLSFDVAQVALQCRPRYHVAPSSQYYHASPPYNIPKSSHVCRFLSLAPVIKEKPSKTAKFVHAIGLVPLKANPPPTTAASTLPCPFLSSPDHTTTKAPSYAISESNASGYSRFNNNNKRSRTRGGDDNNDSLAPPEDPSISTLFLYGLHKDVSGELQSTQSSKVLTTFSKFGVTKVRHPPNSRTSTYCFLEFSDQKQALKCLLDCQGKTTIDDVDLTLKWATQNNHQKRQRHDPQQHYVTQSEAPDSTTLYFHPPKKTENDSADSSPTPDEDFAKELCAYIQTTLEEALNDGNDEGDRVTAETEPALKVEVRTKDHFGFLAFASHAAATMTLAAVTNSTDGGLVVAEPNSAPKPAASIVGTTLRWAKGEPKQSGRNQVLEALGLQREYYPADSRTDCWFCLASPTCETHLIIGVYNQWYAAMPKGPIHPGHMLLVPVTHTNKGAWVGGHTEEWTELVRKLQTHASQAYDMDLLVFERAMETKGGYHTHVQCVPIPKDCTSSLRATMMAHSKACGFDLRTIESDLGITAMISSEDSYFYAEIVTQSHRHRFLYKHDDDASTSVVPLQFAREVLASVLKNPKLAHWRSCVVEKEKESELASDLRSSFAPMTTS